MPVIDNRPLREPQRAALPQPTRAKVAVFARCLIEEWIEPARVQEQRPSEGEVRRRQKCQDVPVRDGVAGYQVVDEELAGGGKCLVGEPVQRGSFHGGAGVGDQDLGEHREPAGYGRAVVVEERDIVTSAHLGATIPRGRGAPPPLLDDPQALEPCARSHRSRCRAPVVDDNDLE